jgi:hypothetical protein
MQRAHTHTRSGLIKVGLQSDCISDDVAARLSVASIPSGTSIIIIAMIMGVRPPSLARLLLSLQNQRGSAI